MSGHVTLILIAIITTCIVFVIASKSLVYGRTVYHLHTTPAAWGSARETCSRYGGRLVDVKDTVKLKADIDIVKNTLGWKGAFTSLGRIWSGLYKFRNETGNDALMWHKCEKFTAATSPNSNISTELLASNHSCVSFDNNTFQLQPTACSTKLPYICQTEEGQCWFLPVENKEFTMAPAANIKVDLNKCAQSCRNSVMKAGGDCWGFTVQNGVCELYNSSERHAFISKPLVYVNDSQEVISYVKICTGGEPTAMKPVTEDRSLQPAADNCSSLTGDTDGEDKGVCYCDCDQPPLIMDPEYMVLTKEEKVDKIVNVLKVNPKETRLSYRKLNSIDDNRPTAQGIGGLGIAILVIVFGGLILLDLDVLISHIARIFCQREERKREDK